MAAAAGDGRRTVIETTISNRLASGRDSHRENIFAASLARAAYLLECDLILKADESLMF